MLMRTGLTCLSRDLCEYPSDSLKGREQQDVLSHLGKEQDFSALPPTRTSGKPEKALTSPHALEIATMKPDLVWFSRVKFDFSLLPLPFTRRELHYPGLGKGEGGELWSRLDVWRRSSASSDTIELNGLTAGHHGLRPSSPHSICHRRWDPVLFQTPNLWF
ncbi:hypothetical protein RRG08_004960 [Elysia crispata]|uniref:Uncharacterized protein n=1 Tax=Elysia crispata TaxID=231223 RepID=A0AAE1DGH6_9GAST|nr:hypothetical protein RRG08_004960 [Elysia crispata]